MREPSQPHAENSDHCWLWAGKCIRGRPSLYAEGVYIGAQRVYWIRKHGDILDPHHILRICSESTCVNPDHHTVKGYLSVAARLGRSPDEVKAISEVIKVRAGDRACWDPSDLPRLGIEPSLVAELASALKTPPLMIHAGFSRLVQLERRRGNVVDKTASPYTASLESIARADRIVEGVADPSPSAPGWLPGD